MRLIDILIETTETLCSAIEAKNGDRAFEVVTLLFMQVLDLCVHVEGTFEIMFPVLEQLKDKIQVVDFEGAELDAFTLLTKFRTIREQASIKGDRLPG